MLWETKVLKNTKEKEQVDLVVNLAICGCCSNNLDGQLVFILIVLRIALGPDLCCYCTMPNLQCARY